VFSFKFSKRLCSLTLGSSKWNISWQYFITDISLVRNNLLLKRCYILYILFHFFIYMFALYLAALLQLHLCAFERSGKYYLLSGDWRRFVAWFMLILRVKKKTTSFFFLFALPFIYVRVCTSTHVRTVLNACGIPQSLADRRGGQDLSWTDWGSSWSRTAAERSRRHERPPGRLCYWVPPWTPRCPPTSTPVALPASAYRNQFVSLLRRMRQGQHIFTCFYRATLCVSAVFAVGRCRPSSVCLSICLSVTFIYCIQKSEDIVKLLLRPGSPISLVLLTPAQRRYPLPAWRKIHRDGKIFAIFDWNRR